MKKLIIDVLKDMSQGPSTITLASPIFRETIANAIIAAIKTNKKGWVLDLSTLDTKPKLTREEIETQRYKEDWTCAICGENTYDVVSEYIGTGTNHLGCEFEDEKRVSKDRRKSDFGSTSDRRKGDRREKNWSQEKHEEKVFLTQTEKYKKEKEKAKQLIDKSVEDHERRKLSEEIVSDTDTGYIYESRDGGKTVYKRKMGSDKRELVKDWKEKNQGGKVE
tara:strand:- start:382 stop:1044 length:663 start_codon:yes stop_codon:yes gene_type:complete